MIEFGRIVNINQAIYLILGECTYKLSSYTNNLFAEEIPLNNKIMIKNKINIDLNGIKNETEKNEKYHFYAIIDKNEVVAKLCVIFNDIDGFAKEGKSIYVSCVGVVEDKKHQGYGTALFKELFQEFNNLDIILKVLCKNISAINFYQKLGFRIDEFRNDKEDGDYYIMSKKNFNIEKKENF